MNIAQAIIDTAHQVGIDPRLALEVAIQESGLDPNAISPKGAIGVFQLLPSTAAQLGVDPYDVGQNISGGVRYLSNLLSQFGDAAMALAAYDWGPGNVSHALQQHGGDWLSYAPSETQDYVSRIMGNVTTQYQANLGPIPIPTPLVSAGPAAFDPDQFRRVAWFLALVFGAFMFSQFALEQTR